ncbi:MAG: [LysW]-aminoadipate kinase [Flexilinea sp.]
MMTENSEKITVVKIGGTEGVDFSSICENIARLISAGQTLVLVHGGSAEANQLGIDLNIPPRFITSPSGHTSRYTDLKTMEVFIMAVNGKVNTQLVSRLQAKGVNAFGLSGLDGRLIRAVRKEAIQSVENGKRRMIRDDYSGKIESVDAVLIRLLLAAGTVPVIAPVAAGQTGEPLNVDADRVAAEVAAAISADTLILLTAVPGLMKVFPDESTLIRKIEQKDLPQMQNYAEGRMKKKVLGAQEALEKGVKNVLIADGRVENPIDNALAGNCTWIC